MASILEYLIGPIADRHDDVANTQSQRAQLELSGSNPVRFRMVGLQPFLPQEPTRIISNLGGTRLCLESQELYRSTHVTTDKPFGRINILHAKQITFLIGGSAR